MYYVNSYRPEDIDRFKKIINYLYNFSKKYFIAFCEFVKKFCEFVKNYIQPIVITYIQPIAIITAIILFVWEWGDRENDRLFRAWNIVYTSSGKGGDGMIDALQYLNKKGKSLNNLDLSNAVLDGINLENAKLARTKFQNTSLKNANLKGADLSYSTGLLINNLTSADLRDADLRFTKDIYYHYTGKEKSDNKHHWNIKISGANIFGSDIMVHNFKEWAIKNYAVEEEESKKWPLKTEKEGGD